MKKFLFVGMMLFCSIFAFSATSANVVVNATINQYLNVTPVTSTVTLTMTGDGTGVQGTDTITAMSNINAWKVTVTSANGSAVKSGALSVPYKVKIDNPDSATNSFSTFIAVPASNGNITFTKKTKKQGTQLLITISIDDHLS